MPRRARAKRTFGHAEQVRPSGRWRARFTGPDLGRHSAPLTFDTERDAEAWLDAEQRLILADPEGWLPPKARILWPSSVVLPGDVRGYAETWLARRKVEGAAAAPGERIGAILDGCCCPRRCVAPDEDHARGRAGLVRDWHHSRGRAARQPPDVARPELRLAQEHHGKRRRSGADGWCCIAFNPCAIRGAARSSGAAGLRSSRPPNWCWWRTRCLPVVAFWCSWPRGVRCGAVRSAS